MFVQSALTVVFVSLLTIGCTGHRVGAEVTIAQVSASASAAVDTEQAPPQATPAPPPPPPEAQFSKYLEVTDPKLTKIVTITHAEARFRGDLLQTSVTLRNVKKKPVSITYKFMWFDKDGFEISNEGQPWVPLTLQGIEDKTVQGTAPNPTAKTFKIKVGFQ